MLVACQEEKYPGYTEAEPGVFYKLHIPGESGKKAGPEDYYEVIMMNRFQKEILYDSWLESATGTVLLQSGSSRYFSVLGEGDSATFLLPGSGLALPGMPDTGMIEMNVKVVRILSPEQAADLQDHHDLDAGEVVMIQRYLQRLGKPYTPDSSGVVTLENKPGNGKNPSSGDSVLVQLKGETLGGRVFDDSKKYGGFQFTWGTEGQVLPGIRKVLAGMKEGGYAKIILPSRLAFGTDGSSTGIVPSHVPVIYTIELISTE